jgi:hypothetical protein
MKNDALVPIAQSAFRCHVKCGDKTKLAGSESTSKLSFEKNKKELP